jgi:hypothetical protein
MKSYNKTVERGLAFINMDNNNSDCFIACFEVNSTVYYGSRFDYEIYFCDSEKEAILEAEKDAKFHDRKLVKILPFKDRKKFETEIISNLKTRFCGFCNTEFVALHSQQKYCSKKCSYEVQKTRSKKLELKQCV